MRNLFFALVLANLAFAAWHAWFAGPARPARPPPQEVPGITLVSELSADAARQVAPQPETTVDASSAPARSLPLPNAEQGAAEELANAPARTEPGDAARSAEAPGSRCVTVGPFRELAQAASAAGTLRSAGYAPLQRVAEGDVWIGYWVYVQAIPTIAEANEILERIRAQGITDAYVIPNTDTGNLISLGVFTEISGVTRRRDDMRALGFEPAVVDRTRRATVYWVDVQLAAEQTLDLEALQTPGRISRLEQRRCAPDA